MALSVLGGVLPPPAARAAIAGQRRSSRTDHSRDDTGRRRPTRRSLLPRRDAPMAGQLAIARAGSRQCAHRDRRRDRNRKYAGSTAALRGSRVWRSRHGAGGLHRDVASRGQSTAARPHRFRGRRVARRSAGASVPASAEPTTSRVRVARGVGRRRAATRSHPDGHLGSGVRLRPRHGARLRRRRGRAFHGRRSVVARRHRIGSPRRRHRCGGLRPGPAGLLSGVVAEVRLSRQWGLPRLPHVRPSDGSQTGPGHRPRGRCRGQSALRSAARRPCDRYPCQRLRRHGAAPVDQRVRAHRPARARGGRLRHRVVRALVVRGAGLAGAAAARAARGRYSHRHTQRRPRQRIRRRRRRSAAEFVGFGKGLASLVRAESGRSGGTQHRGGRHRARLRRQSPVPDRSRADPRPGRRSDPAGDPVDGLQRLAVHGQQGLRGRLRALPRPPARPRHPRDRRCTRRRAPRGRGPTC